MSFFYSRYVNILSRPWPCTGSIISAAHTWDHFLPFAYLTFPPSHPLPSVFSTLSYSLFWLFSFSPSHPSLLISLPSYHSPCSFSFPPSLPPSFVGHSHHPILSTLSAFIPPILIPFSPCPPKVGHLQ